MLPLINNLPSSYTLQTDFDFEVEYRNYTEDVAFSREVNKLIKEGVLDESHAYDFNLYTQFDDDHFALRLEGDAKPYRFGSYLVY